MKTLVIVESPAKAEKIQGFLGKDYVVMASKGHIADLAKGGKFGLGVDIDNDFKPRYVLMPDKIELLDDIMGAAKQCDQILVASDPDREGEAIAWHLKTRLEDFGKPIKRVVFNKIKKPTVLKAVKDEVRDVDINLFHAQEARRILDRVVGFMASPFLMNFFGPKLSAGRVQSVVTRMVIDREREIESFTPEEFWTIQVSLSKDGKEGFIMKYPYKLSDQKSADDMKTKLSDKKAEYIVSDVIADEEKVGAPKPLITSTLQRIMSKDHNLSPDRTMKAAQALYESGYVSYIRTDSVRVGDETIDEARKWLTSNSYSIPVKPNIHKNKNDIQDAHECIYPTDITLLPHDNMAIIDPDEKIVYETIWKYFLASQMTPAVYNTLKVIAHVKDDTSAEVRASGKALKTNGYLDMLGVSGDSKIEIPNLIKGDVLKFFGSKPVKMERKQTQPPPRYSYDKLIKELETKNIGRPATYAELLSKIAVRNYVEQKGNVFHATDLGKKITDILLKYFTFMDYDYTAKMEDQLDEIEHGKVDHINMLKKFYPDFKKELVPPNGIHDYTDRPSSNFIDLMNWVAYNFTKELSDYNNINKFVHNRIIIDGQFLQFCKENNLKIKCLYKDSIISWKTEHEFEKFFVQGVFLIKSENVEFIHAALFHKGNHNEDEISFFIICSESNYDKYVDIRNRFDNWVLERDRGNLHIRVFDGEDISYDKDSTWEELFLPDTIKNDIKSIVEGFLSSKDFYVQNKIPWKRGILLYGMPGNGKTSIIRTIMSIYNFKPVTIAQDANTESVRDAFSYAQEQSPSLLYFEDLDSVLERGGIDTSSFLNLMDGISSQNGILVIATANDLSKFKDNITDRPSRFDRKFNIPLPTQEMAYIYLKRWFGKMLKPDKYKEIYIFSEKHGFSYAYLKELYISSVFEALSHNRKTPSYKDVLNTLNRIVKEKNITKGKKIVDTDKYFNK